MVHAFGFRSWWGAEIRGCRQGVPESRTWGLGLGLLLV
jgi:hypothetical protein